MLQDRRWNCAAGLVILATAIFSAAQWPSYPYFLDSYYHLNVIHSFKEAGGVTLHDFWEAAPEGRPHLYPPLFHLLMLPAYGCGVAPLVLARFWCWISLPLLLTVAHKTFYRVTTPRQACLTLIALSAPYSFFLSAVNYLPATLVLAAACGLFLALLQKRGLAAGLLLGVCFWLHAGLPWLLVLTLLLFGILQPEFRKTISAALGLGLVIASPWLLHMARHLALIQFQPRGEERLLDLSLLWFGLGAAGLVIALKKKDPAHRFLIALVVGFLPMALGYRFRWMSAQGLFPWLLLAGVTMEWAAQRGLRPLLLGSGLSVLALFSPTLHGRIDEPRFSWADTTWSTLSGTRLPVPRATGQSLYRERLMKELETHVLTHTQPDELLYSNIPYFAGMLASTTGRATTNQMLREMAEGTESTIAPARLIVWVKNLSGSLDAELQQAVKQYSLRSLGETDLAWVYLNPNAQAKRQVSGVFLPGWASILMIGFCLAVLVWDLKRR